MLQSDTFLHKGLRKRLIAGLRGSGITDERVLEAMSKVPRHFFLDSAFLEFAYSNKAFPIGAGQTISQPYTVAFQSQLLQVEPRQTVLEVGTGSGYQTAVLLELGARVYTIERQRELFLKSQTLLAQMGYNPHFFYGDGYKGVPSYGPYSRILVTAGAPQIPTALIAQLAIGGRMVIPVGDDKQKMTLVERISETHIKTSTYGNFSFVPMLKGRR